MQSSNCTTLIRFERHFTIAASDEKVVCDFLAIRTALSKSRIKQAMIAGAVWLSRNGRRRQRVRRASKQLLNGDRISIYYDELLLTLKPPEPQLIADYGGYSVWYKPANLLTQGTDYGDHCTLLRHAELHFQPRREVFPIHRLDREASGLLLVGHTQRTTDVLSTLFRKQKVEKHYRVSVKGDLSGIANRRIDLPVMNKPARTRFEMLHYAPVSDSSEVRVTIETGRMHQIRQHFAAIGHPVVGDPRYGRGNKNATGMQLCAYELRFICPLSSQPRHFIWPVDQANASQQV